MSCSDNLVTKAYLDQALEAQKRSLLDTEVPQVTKAFLESPGYSVPVQNLPLNEILNATGGLIAAAIGLLTDQVVGFAGTLREIGQDAFTTEDRLQSLEVRLFAAESQVTLINQDLNRAYDYIDYLSGVIDRYGQYFNEYEVRFINLEREIANVETKLTQKFENIERIFEEQYIEIRNIQQVFVNFQVEQIRQRYRLDYLDESFREAELLFKIINRELADIYIDLTGSIAEDKRNIYELQEALRNLPQLAPAPEPIYFPPSLRSYPSGDTTVIEVTTEGGTSRTTIPTPTPPPLPDLTPSFNLERSGFFLKATVGIAGKTATDDVQLPEPLSENLDLYQIFVRDAVNLSELEAQAQAIREQQTLTNAAIMTVIANSGQILNQTAPEIIRQSAAEGACNTLNGGCGQNFRQQIRQDGAQNIQDLTLPSVAGVAGQVGTLQARLAQLHTNLGIDRAMNLINLALGIHNAVAVSRGVLQTLNYVIDSTAQAAGFQWKDQEGNQISFGTILGKSVTQVIQSAIGEDLYNNLNANFNKLLRVYQTGQNVAWAVRGIVDPIRAATDIITENTGKIGNALRKSGAVLENSYQVMPERATLQSATAKKIETFTASVQDIGEGLETFGELTENVIEIQENAQQLDQSTAAFDQEISTLTEQDETKRETEKTSSQTPNITLADLVPQPIETP